MSITRALLLLTLPVVMTTGCPSTTPPPRSAPIPSPYVQPPAPSSPALPGWLVGTWKGEHNGLVTVERWWRPHDNLMVGLNRTLKGGQEVSREHLQIHSAGDRLVYTAWPPGQPVTRFKMVRAASGSVEFENPEHDFPRLISYGLKGDKLSVKILGLGQDDELRSASWTWARDPAKPGAEASPIVREVEVAAPLDTVWQAWTTTAGVKGFFAPEARVEATPGGAFEMYFMADAPAGKKGSEGCVVVATRPGELLAFTWNFPPTIPSLRDAHTLVTVELKATTSGTRVKLVHSGFQAGEDWTKGRAYFEGAWKTVLNRLSNHFNNKTATPQ